MDHNILQLDCAKCIRLKAQIEQNKLRYRILKDLLKPKDDEIRSLKIELEDKDRYLKRSGTGAAKRILKKWSKK